MTYYLGIDPGLSGALALLSFPDARPRVVTYAIPTIRVRVGTKWRRRVDRGALTAWFEHHAPSIFHATIEDVHTAPHDGAIAAFAFGLVVGTLHTLCAAYKLPFWSVSPHVWKGALGISADKAEARALATKYFPKDCHQWERAGQDGHAEAALIALWGQIHPGAV